MAKSFAAMVWRWLTVTVVRRGMMATYVFSTDFYIGAESEEQARDGLLELLNEIVGRDDSSPFDLIETLDEGEA